MVDPTTELIRTIEAMRAAVDQGPEIYRPGAFWTALLEINSRMIREGGIDNFKRSVSTNYYNWLVFSVRDPQFKHAVRTWLSHPTLGPLLSHIDEIDGLQVFNDSHFARPSWRAHQVYRLFVSAAWECARREDEFALSSRLSEPEVGNPIRVRRAGRIVSQDLANSIVECSFAARSGCIEDGARVAELGAGYGRLAHACSEARQLVYCIFDIPPALAVAEWYLTRILGSTRVVPFSPRCEFADIEQKLRPGVVAFFTPDQLARFPDRWFDLAQTISTLSEMPRRQGSHFLELLGAKSGRAIFIKQWRHSLNARDNVTLTEADYQLRAPWQLTLRRVDPIQPGFFNHLWARPVG